MFLTFASRRISLPGSVAETPEMTLKLRRTATPVDRTSEATAEVPVVERPWTITLNILVGPACAA